MAVDTTDNFDRIVIQPQQQQQQQVVSVIQCPVGKTLKVYKIEYWNLYVGGNPVLYLVNHIQVGVSGADDTITTVKDVCHFPLQLDATQPVNYIPKNENTMRDPLFKVEGGQFLNVTADGLFALVVTLFEE